MPREKRELWTLDAETDPFSRDTPYPQPFIWGLYNGEKEVFKTFTATADLVAYLSGKRWVVYAHNGGKFDYHYLTPFIASGSKLDIIAGRLARFRIGDCEFRDSFSIIPVALAQYEKTKIDYALFERGVRDEHMDEITDYLFDDCKNLWDLVSEFEKRFGRNLTIAGTSMKEWQKMAGVKAPQSSAEFYSEFRNFYYGGRVQCFKQGYVEGRHEVVDVKSAYPYAMLHRHPFSVEYQGIERRIKKESFTDMGANFYTIEAESSGAFPVIGTDHKTYYPADHVKRLYWVTGWELATALETNTVKLHKVHKIFRFKETIDFADYIYHFYQHRLQAMADGDEITKLFDKLLMNSLYGKFAANPDKYHNYFFHSIDEFRGIVNSGKKASIWGAGCIRQEPIERPRFYNLATGASITGFERAYLWRHICQSEGVAYCDTDSITAEVFKRFEFGSNLGQWESEGVYDRLYIAGKKAYVLEDSTGKHKTKMATKGFNATPEQMKALVLQDESLPRNKKGRPYIEYRPVNPTYSVKKELPFFSDRDIVSTAEDISIIPKKVDPAYEYTKSV